ncbi:hypothetical protein BJX63DRAFT_427471 [Aspergillus granulosus]|uniref:F-box domain-containing protein n=1 Tax=Aspergillus granulosus TaxID=176169 RepID=A0ABR4I137_9EURO
MASDSILSTGSIELMIEDPHYAVELCPAPIVQCIQVKPISVKPNGVTWWRAVLSDGKHWIRALLTSHLGQLVDDGELVKYCICRLKQCRPTSIRDKTILVIQQIEIIRSFGILPKTGRPLPINSTVQLSGEMVGFSTEKQHALLSWHLISRFPLEIFNMIVTNLNQRDKLALSLASKKLCALVTPSLYSVVELRSKKRLVDFAGAMARDPSLRSFVRTCMLEGDVCCIDAEACNFHANTITSLPLLCHLGFQSCHEVTDTCSMIPMLQRLVSDKILQPLRSFHLDLNGILANDLPKNLQEQILQTMFSAPLIKYLQVSYCHREHEDFPNRRIREITNLRLKPPKPELTSLRTLVFQWDGLPLPLLSTLLQLPRSLETLTLRISGRYDHALGGPAMTLDCTLSPVADTLRELELDFVHRVSGNYPEAVGLLWGTKGLTAFTRLQYLSISGNFLREVQGFNGKTPWLPPSLVSLCITTSKLLHCLKPEPNTESSPVCRRLVRGEHFVYFDPATVRTLSSLCGMLESVPNLRQFLIKEGSHGYGTYQRSFVLRYPPIALVGEPLQPLVDRGIRIGLEFREAANIWLTVKVITGF